jgi:hypothetical protein
MTTERHEYLRQRVYAEQTTLEEYVEFAGVEYDMTPLEATRVYCAQGEIELPDGNLARS